MKLHKIIIFLVVLLNCIQFSYENQIFLKIPESLSKQLSNIEGNDISHRLGAISFTHESLYQSNFNTFRFSALKHLVGVTGDMDIGGNSFSNLQSLNCDCQFERIYLKNLHAPPIVKRPPHKPPPNRIPRGPIRKPLRRISRKPLKKPLKKKEKISKKILAEKEVNNFGSTADSQRTEGMQNAEEDKNALIKNQTSLQSQEISMNKQNNLQNTNFSQNANLNPNKMVMNNNNFAQPNSVNNLSMLPKQSSSVQSYDNNFSQNKQQALLSDILQLAQTMNTNDANNNNGMYTNLSNTENLNKFNQPPRSSLGETQFAQQISAPNYGNNQNKLLAQDNALVNQLLSQQSTSNISQNQFAQTNPINQQQNILANTNQNISNLGQNQNLLPNQQFESQTQQKSNQNAKLQQLQQEAQSIFQQEPQEVKQNTNQGLAQYPQNNLNLQQNGEISLSNLQNTNLNASPFQNDASTINVKNNNILAKTQSQQVNNVEQQNTELANQLIKILASSNINNNNDQKVTNQNAMIKKSNNGSQDAQNTNTSQNLQKLLMTPQDLQTASPNFIH